MREYIKINSGISNDDDDQHSHRLVIRVRQECWREVNANRRGPSGDNRSTCSKPRSLLVSLSNGLLFY